MRHESTIRIQLEQNRLSLAQWESGFLAPTEPDQDERDRIKAELRAAIHVLEWVLEETRE